MKNSMGDLGVQTHGLLVLYLTISEEAVFKQLYSFCATAVDWFVTAKKNQLAAVTPLGPGSTGTVHPWAMLPKIENVFWSRFYLLLFELASTAKERKVISMGQRVRIPISFSFNVQPGKQETIFKPAAVNCLHLHRGVTVHFIQSTHLVLRLLFISDAQNSLSAVDPGSRTDLFTA